jgi:hypothetical protein
LPTSFEDQVDERGWAAGAVIPQALLPKLTPHIARPTQPETIITADDWLIVISQTCDVVQRKLENEPFVEVLHCKPIAGLRSEFQGRKSTRRLDFRPNKDAHGQVVLSAHAIADRYIIPREFFVEHSPDPDRCLSDKAVGNLQQWYALRYTRPAWPDEFCERIKKVRKELVAAVRMVESDDIEVRVAIAERDDELPDNLPYHVSVFIVVDQNVWINYPNVRKEAFSAFSAFVSALSNCDGVEVNKKLSGVKSGDDFSWQLTRTTDEWNFANLSSED